MFDWKMLQPDDGYFAEFVREEDPPRVSLRFGFKVSGELLYCRTIGEVTDPAPEAVGDLKRKLILLKAMADYLNAGGDGADLQEILPQPDEGGVWVEGWHYFDTGIEPATGNRVHEFVNLTYDKFVRWVHNEYIDVDLTREQMDDDRIHASSLAVPVDLEDSGETGQPDEGADGVFGP